MPMPTAAHVRAADAAVRIGPAAAGRELPADRRDHRGGARDRRGGGPPRLRLPGRASRRSPRPSRRPGSPSSGPTVGRIAALGDKLRRADAVAARSACRSSRDPRARRRSTGPDQVAGDRSRRPSGRLPAAGQGRGGRRRPGDAPGRRRPRTCRRALVAGSREAAAAFGDGAVYLEREVRPGPPHRGPAARRRAGRGRRPRRAGLLDPAAPPEAGRGGARAGPDDGRSARAPRPGGPGRARPPGCSNAATAEFLLDRGRPVLVPRGEHPAPGRARRDRARQPASTSSGSSSGWPPARPLSDAGPARPPTRAAEPDGHAIEVRISRRGSRPAPSPGAGPGRDAG